MTIRSRVATDEYRENFDRIFGKKKDLTPNTRTLTAPRRGFRVEVLDAHAEALNAEARETLAYQDDHPKAD